MYVQIKCSSHRMNSWTRMMLGLCALALPLSAATTYTATASSCGGPVTQSNQTGAFVDSGNLVCTSGSNLIGQGSAAARADAGGVGAFVEWYGTGNGSFAQASGEINTTFVINGPGPGPIDVSINFVLSGFLGGGTGANQVSFRTIENFVDIFAEYPVGLGAGVYNFSGKAEEIFNSGANPGLSSTFSGQLAPAGTNCLAPNCDIKTPTFRVYSGYTNTLRILARATVSTSFSSSPGYGVASFLNTFAFDKNKPVFDLPSGYTLTIEGMNVVNNCVVGGSCGATSGEVPEPATYALVGAGLAAALILRRRR